MENLGLHGKMLQLIKAIYKSTNCAVKYDGKVTQFFDLSKGVRQGCPLSPLLFNLYVNDLIELIDSATKCQVGLSEIEINSLMYADDIVVLAHSEKDLQAKMDTLSKFCKDRKLEINTRRRNVWSLTGEIHCAKLKLL